MPLFQKLSGNQLLFLSAVVGGLSFAQVMEPGTNGVFFGMAGGTFVPLEGQTLTIHGQAKFGGFGGIKVTGQFKPAKSPVRFQSHDAVFAVRAFPSWSAVDPDTLYVLRALKASGSKRELVIVESHGALGLAGTDANLAGGVIAVRFERLGESSLKITPDRPLPPGEYALSRRSALTDLFCFGVDK